MENRINGLSLNINNIFYFTVACFYCCIVALGKKLHVKCWPLGGGGRLLYNYQQLRVHWFGAGADLALKGSALPLIFSQ